MAETLQKQKKKRDLNQLIKQARKNSETSHARETPKKLDYTHHIITHTIMGDAISSLLFQPPPPTYLHPSRHFWLNTSAGSRIPAFFIERPNAQVTILFSHGLSLIHI